MVAAKTIKGMVDKAELPDNIKEELYAKLIEYNKKYKLKKAEVQAIIDETVKEYQKALIEPERP